MTDQRIYVAQDTVDAAGEGTWMAAKGSKMGFQVIQDFYTQMAIEGRIYQVRAGTIATPLISDVVVTDTAAEFAVDPATGYIALPVFEQFAVETDAATLANYTTKSAAGASSVAAAFVPLPLMTGGAACASTARVAAAAGGCTVPAELATTTKVHFYYCAATASLARPLIDWTPRTPPVIGAADVLYTQVASTGTACQYYAHLDFIELPLAAVA
jgi:hypothetical protein